MVLSCVKQNNFQELITIGSFFIILDSEQKNLYCYMCLKFMFFFRLLKSEYENYLKI